MKHFETDYLQASSHNLIYVTDGVDTGYFKLKEAPSSPIISEGLDTLPPLCPLGRSHTLDPLED